MNDFNTQLQCDEFIPGDDFLEWVAAMEAFAANRDEEDARWDEIKEEISSEWAENQPKPF
ncbi:MAG: hypothetical protein GY748_26165 [Planctomycetaceae bacterium]|nr:hypothetical protein [Planctomycetaceae bacterium]